MILKVIFANSVDPDQTAPLGAVWSGSTLQGSHCLALCKKRFEKFARIFSRRHKQTTVSDAGFPGILRLKESMCFICHFSKVSSDMEENSYLQKGAFLANGVDGGWGGGGIKLLWVSIYIKTTLNCLNFWQVNGLRLYKCCKQRRKWNWQTPEIIRTV